MPPPPDDSFQRTRGCSNLPATNNAAVDGYAVDAGFEGNLAHEFKLSARLLQAILSPAHRCGEAVRIFTGAVMPRSGCRRHAGIL